MSAKLSAKRAQGRPAKQPNNKPKPVVMKWAPYDSVLITRAAQTVSGSSEIGQHTN